MSEFVVVEGPRLSGKTRVCQHLMQKKLLPELFKDQCFLMSQIFGITADQPEIFESFIRGKDACLVQMLDRSEESLLLDRFFMTSCVYSAVFRGLPVSYGLNHFESMNTIIETKFPTMKDRLNYIVLDIQDPEEALRTGLQGREGKDGLEDNMKLLEEQIRLYSMYADLFESRGYNVCKLHSYHTNPVVETEAGMAIEMLWEDKACAAG